MILSILVSMELSCHKTRPTYTPGLGATMFKKTSFGFTLIELLASLLLLGVIFFLSFGLAPSLHHKNQLQIMVDELKGAINTAKLQSLITGDALALTHLPDSDNWADGLLLFIDNNKHQYTSGEVLFHEWHWKSLGFHIEWHGFQSKEYLIFSSDIWKSTINGYFEIVTPMNQKVVLVVNRLGRVRTDHF